MNPFRLSRNFSASFCHAGRVSEGEVLHIPGWNFADYLDFSASTEIIGMIGKSFLLCMPPSFYRYSLCSPLSPLSSSPAYHRWNSVSSQPSNVATETWPQSRCFCRRSRRRPLKRSASRVTCPPRHHGKVRRWSRRNGRSRYQRQTQTRMPGSRAVGKRHRSGSRTSRRGYFRTSNARP